MLGLKASKELCYKIGHAYYLFTPLYFVHVDILFMIFSEQADMVFPRFSQCIVLFKSLCNYRPFNFQAMRRTVLDAISI